MFAGLLDWFGLSETPLKQAGITGLFSFAGVVVTGFFAVIAWAANQVLGWWGSRRQRRERHRDFRLAIWAEIDAVWRQLLWARDLQALIDDIHQRFKTARGVGRTYRPFVVPFVDERIFPALRRDIVALKEEEIGPIVQFYHRMEMLRRFAQDLRSKSFAGLEDERREQMMVHYLTMVASAYELAEQAIKSLEQDLLLPQDMLLAYRKKKLLEGLDAAA